MSVRCPCNSKKGYAACCGLYIEQKIPAPTPEALMRSRYTAYALGKFFYIKETMALKALSLYEEEYKNPSEKAIRWRHLKIINTFPEKCTQELGFIEFKAVYNEEGINKLLHECSEFHKINDRWYYVDGILKA